MSDDTQPPANPENAGQYKNGQPAKDGEKLPKGFYPPTVVASIVTALLLGSREDGTLYESFEHQLTETRDKARSIQGREEQDLADLISVVHDFYNDGNQDLFLNAHIGVKLLLTALANSKRWSSCLTVNRANVLELVHLTRH